MVFEKGYYCQYCELIFKKQNNEVEKKILRQDQSFSIRLPFANKKIKELYYAMGNTKRNSTQDKTDKLQS